MNATFCSVLRVVGVTISILALASCTPKIEKAVDPERLAKHHLTPESVASAREWSNLFWDNESVIAAVEDGSLPADVLQAAKDQQSFRDGWRLKSKMYWNFYSDLDIVADARWGKFFQWPVIWRCMVLLISFSMVAEFLNNLIKRFGKGSFGAKSVGCFGLLLTMVWALPALWYLIVGIF